MVEQWASMNTSCSLLQACSCSHVHKSQSSALFLAGRLLRANQIIFNWDRLASWINLTEEWPYRTSWIILFLEETDGVSDQVALKTIYERYTLTHPLTHSQMCPISREIFQSIFSFFFLIYFFLVIYFCVQARIYIYIS